MPEGPEIRYQKEVLQPYIINKTITKIEAFSKKRVYIPKKSKVLEVGTQGKLLWIRTSDYYIHIHFGMTGWLYLDKDQDEPEYTKYIIHLGSKKVYIESIRKFTKLNIYKKTAHDRKVAKLGIDILKEDFTYEAYYKLISNRKMMITKFLLDQDKLCGVGNYQKSDALYLARIHPKAKTDELTDKQIKDLYEAIKYIVFSSLLTWFTKDRIKIPIDIQNVKPSKTKVPYKFIVYGEEKDPLGNKITFEDVGGRGTYYVKKLQKL
jgi:DNA-formamidopyrimidine glycosylase